MPDCRLTHAATDRKGTLLLGAGTRLSRQVMETRVSGQTAAMSTCRRYTAWPAHHPDDQAH